VAARRRSESDSDAAALAELTMLGRSVEEEVLVSCEQPRFRFADFKLA
jgi:hypothetical protein